MEPKSKCASYEPMLLIAGAAAFGIVLDRTMEIPLAASTTASLLLLVLWFCFRRYSASLSSIVLLLSIAALGSAWHHIHWHCYHRDEIGRFVAGNGLPCCVELIIRSEARVAPARPDAFADENLPAYQTRFEVDLVALRDDRRWIPACGNAELVIHGQAERLHSGDRIRVLGRLSGAAAPTNPGQFDFGQFCRSQRKLAFVHVYQPQGVERVDQIANSPPAWLSTLRKRLDQSVWRNVGESQAPFASAILLGNRHQLDQASRDRFMETGTIHLLAISGLHVGILAGSFLILLHLPFSNRQVCLWATIVFVIFYAWLVEFRSPATRATILIVLFCLGRLWGERSFSLNLLAIAAVLVLTLNPSDLFAIGPQLSFLAVATLTIGKDLIFPAPAKDPVQELIDRSRGRPVKLLKWSGRKLRTAIFVSSIIWLMAVPLVANRFHLITPAGLLVNPILLLPIATALFSGLAVMCCDWALVPVAQASGLVCNTSLAGIDWIVTQAHHWPWGHLWTPGPPSWAVALFYGGAVLLVAYPPTRLNRRWQVGALVAWIVTCWWIPNSTWTEDSPSRDLVCTVLDVGHGNAVVIEQPNGETWLYDGGSLGSEQFGARTIAASLWYRGISTIDVVVISHADIDHFNSLPRVAEQFHVGKVLVSRPMLTQDSDSVQKLLQAFRRLRIQVSTVEAGDLFRLGKRSMVEVLSPGTFGFHENDNADSIVLQLHHDGRSVLLPGDLEGAGLESLLAKSPRDVDVLMAPHHGSGNSQPERLTAWCSPEFVAISGGNNRVKDDTVVRFQALSSSAKVVQPTRTIGRTDQDGAIQIQLSAENVRWSTWCQGRWQAVEKPEK